MITAAQIDRVMPMIDASLDRLDAEQCDQLVLALLEDGADPNEVFEDVEDEADPDAPWTRITVGDVLALQQRRDRARRPERLARIRRVIEAFAADFNAAEQARTKVFEST